MGRQGGVSPRLGCCWCWFGRCGASWPDQGAAGHQALEKGSGAWSGGHDGGQVKLDGPECGRPARPLNDGDVSNLVTQ